MQNLFLVLSFGVTPRPDVPRNGAYTRPDACSVESRAVIVVFLLWLKASTSAS